MGISAVLRDLPRLIGRIGSTAKAIVAAKPDCLITIDSPEFTLRVARKVHAADPSIPIVHYVCPSVWAWRPGRAKDMKGFVDRVLCILPFEVGELQRLDGPPGTYVGHRLARDPGIARAAAMQAEPRDLSDDREKTLLLLPGSRRGEVNSLLEPFRETVSILHERGNRLRLLLPTVPHVEQIVRQATASWAQQPEIFSDPDRKWQAFGEADAALIASGTVSLELALARRADGVLLQAGLFRPTAARAGHVLGDAAAEPDRRQARRVRIHRFLRPPTGFGAPARSADGRYGDAPLAEDGPYRRRRADANRSPIGRNRC